MRRKFVRIFTVVCCLLCLVSQGARAQERDLSQLATAKTYQDFVQRQWQCSEPPDEPSFNPPGDSSQKLGSLRFEREHDEPIYLEQTAIAARKIIPIGPDNSRTSVLPITRSVRILTINLREGAEPQRRLMGICIALVRSKPVNIDWSITTRLDHPLEENETRWFSELHVSF